LPISSLPIYENKHGLRPSELTAGDVAAFDRVNFEGKIKVNSSSGIIDNIGELPVNLIVDGRKSVINDVKRIVPISIQGVAVKGDEGGMIDKGFGFYSTIIMNQSITRVVGEPATVLIESNKDNHNIAVVTGNEIQFNLGKSSILLRQPVVHSSGVADFKNFYAYGNLYDKIPVLGQNITTTGENSFDVDYSDEFTITSSASFKGNTLPSRAELMYDYDELGSLANIFSLPYLNHLIVLCVLLGVITMYLMDKKFNF
jgi:hypothetical protein